MDKEFCVTITYGASMISGYGPTAANALRDGIDRAKGQEGDLGVVRRGLESFLKSVEAEARKGEGE